MSLVNLCDDILLDMSVCLEIRDRVRLSLVNKKLKRLLSINNIESLDMSNTIPSKVEKVLNWLIRCRHSSLKSLNLHGCSSTQLSTLLPSLFNNNIHIQRLNVQHCPSIEESTIRCIAQLKDLRQLSLYETREGLINSKILGEIFESCSKLEIIDIRGQRLADDVIAARMAELPNLKKISLVATSITEFGFNLLLQKCNQLQRIGSMDLHSNGGPFVSESDSVEELQIGYTNTPLSVDISKFPKIKFLGVSALSLVWSGIDWSVLAKSKTIRQITAENNRSYPSEFISCLIAVRKQLIHLSVGEIDDSDFESAVSEMISMKHLSVENPSVGLLQNISQLPELRQLEIEEVDSEVFSSFISWLSLSDQRDTSFVNVNGLQLSFSNENESSTEQNDIISLIKTCKQLTSFYIGSHSCDTAMLIKSLPVLQMTDFKTREFGGVLGDSIDTISMMKNLVTFDFPSHVLSSVEAEALSEVVYSLQKLVVVNLDHRFVFEDRFFSWRKISGSGPPRFFRHFNPFGYLEESGIKPHATFLTIFEDYNDSRFGIIRP